MSNTEAVVNDLYQTVQGMKEIMCTEETCSNIQKEVELLDIEMKAVQVDLYTNIQGSCSKETCDKKSDKSYIDAAITEIYETIDLLEDNTCSKETCSQIQFEADEKGNNIQADIEKLQINTCSMKTCSKLQGEIQTIDNCMENPWDVNCMDNFPTSNSMPKTITTFSECFRYIYGKSFGID